MVDFLLPYKEKSEGAIAISDAIGATRIKLGGHIKFPERQVGDRVINWGNGNLEYNKYFRAYDLNHPSAVWRAIEKRLSFKAFKANNVPHPELTQDYNTVIDWLNGGVTVYARNTACGMDGEGLVVFHPNDPRPNRYDWNFYTRQVSNEIEYRINAGKETVIDCVEKRNHDSNANREVRTTSNNWLFCRPGCRPSNAVKEVAMAAIRALGLDFGGVDVGVGRDGEVTVFEVNTAPYVGAITVQRYKEFFANAL